jgi:hypothetical protein
MIPFILSIFVLLDGVVTRNPSAWAGPVRALMLAALFSTAWCTLRRSRSAPWSAAVVCGLGAGLTVSQSARDPLIWGLPLVVCYAAAWGWQRIMQREWERDLAITGLIVASYIVLIALSGERPEGLWQRNVLAGVVAVCVPSGMSLPGRRKWSVTGAMIAAIVITGSRGGLLASMVAMFIRGRIHIRTAIIALPVMALGLVFARFRNSVYRVDAFWIALNEFINHPAFGIGPGTMLKFVANGSVRMDHAHNSAVSFVAMTGLTGLAILDAFVMTSARQALDRWQWATLAAFAVCASVDDAFLWLPVGLIVAIVIATNRVTGTPAPSGAS